MAALVLAALLGGCATNGQSSFGDGAATPDGMVHMADKARERGELPVAASLYRKAHDENPQSIKPLVSLGQVLMEMRMPDQAAEAFSAALVLDTHNLEALRGLGNAKLALHQPEQAIAPLKQALSISANDFRVLNALGVAYDMSEDHVGALQYYKTGLKLAPDNSALRSNYRCRWRSQARRRTRSRPLRRWPMRRSRPRNSDRQWRSSMVSPAIRPRRSGFPALIWMTRR